MIFLQVVAGIVVGFWLPVFLVARFEEQLKSFGLNLDAKILAAENEENRQAFVEATFDMIEDPKRRAAALAFYRKAREENNLADVDKALKTVRDIIELQNDQRKAKGKVA